MSTWRTLVLIVVAIVLGGCLGSIAGRAASEMFAAETIRPYLPPASFDDDPASAREMNRRAELCGRTVGIMFGLAVAALAMIWRRPNASVAARVGTACLGSASGIPAVIAGVLANPFGDEHGGVSLGSSIALYTSAFLITGLVTAACSRRPFLSGPLAGVLTMANLTFLVAPPDAWAVLWLMIHSVRGLVGGIITAFFFVLFKYHFSVSSKIPSKPS